MDKRAGDPGRPKRAVMVFIPFGLPPPWIGDLMDGREPATRDGVGGALVELETLLASCSRHTLQYIAHLIRDGRYRVEPEKATDGAVRALEQAEGRQPPSPPEEVFSVGRAVKLILGAAGLSGEGTGRAEALAGEAVQHVYFVAPIPEVRAEVLEAIASDVAAGQPDVDDVRLRLVEEMSYFLAEPSSPTRVRCAAGGALVLLLTATRAATTAAADRVRYAVDHARNVDDLDRRIGNALWRFDHGTLEQGHALAVAEDLLAQAGTVAAEALPPAQAARAGHPTHSGDFSTVDWFGQRYEFNATQARAVALLWAEWEAGGHGLNEATIGDKLASENQRYRLAHTFRSRNAPHPAWGRMIVRVEHGVYALREPAAGITE